MSERSFTPEEEAFLAALWQEYKARFRDGFVKNDVYDFAIKAGKRDTCIALIDSGAITFWPNGRIASIVVIAGGHE